MAEIGSFIPKQFDSYLPTILPESGNRSTLREIVLQSEYQATYEI